MRHNLERAIGLVLLILLAACNPGEDPIPPTKLRLLVLQPGDVGPEFASFGFGPQSVTDFRAGPRRDPNRFGRQDGWVARYRTTNPTAASGPLVIESRADVFNDEDGAKRDLEAYEAEFRDTLTNGAGTGRLIDVPRIADGTVAMTLVQGEGPMAIRFYRIAWRDRNVTALVDVSGFNGSLSLEAALQLARRQERGIVRSAPI